MNKSEARAIVQGVLAELRKLSYAQLVDRLLDEQETSEHVGPTGTRYQVEIQAFWADKQGSGNLLVLASIDDGGWSAFSPLSEDFIRAPDGSFVGE